MTNATEQLREMASLAEDLAELAGELADRLDDRGDNGTYEHLPAFKGYQMVDEVATVHNLKIYRDESGDAWINPMNEEPHCYLNNSKMGELISALEEANR